MSHEHITNAEIEQDIADTEREVAQMQIELAHLEATPRESNDYRWNYMRADARRSGIKERQKFITKLRAILDERAPRPANQETPTNEN